MTFKDSGSLKETDQPSSLEEAEASQTAWKWFRPTESHGNDVLQPVEWSTNSSVCPRFPNYVNCNPYCGGSW